MKAIYAGVLALVLGLAATSDASAQIIRGRYYYSGWPAYSTYYYPSYSYYSYPAYTYSSGAYVNPGVTTSYYSPGVTSYYYPEVYTSGYYYPTYSYGGWGWYPGYYGGWSRERWGWRR